MDRFTELLENEDTLVKPLTLILGIILLAGFLLSGNMVIKGLVPQWGKRQLIFDTIIIALWVGFWVYKRREYPRNKTKKIGIVIALTTENRKEKQRIKVDLLTRFNELIQADNLQDSITVIAFKNYQAADIIPKLTRYSEAVTLLNAGRIQALPFKLLKDWRSIRKRVNGHLFIFGSVSERQSGENTYFIKTNALVVHIPLALALRKELTQDFINIWSTQFNFFEKVEKVGFDFTAHYWFLAAKYIIGSASFASNDVETALKLHERLLKQLEAIGHPNLARIRRRVNSLLVEEHVVLAQRAYGAQDLKLAKTHLDKSFAVDPKNYSAHLLKAIIEFTNEGDPHKALKTIEDLSRYAGRNRTWQYSQGFLLMYLERFDKALRVYRQLAKSHFEGEDFVIPEVISFNEERLVVDPSRIQSDFILGFLHFRKTANYPKALQHFEDFLKKSEGNRKYKLLADETEKCLKELRGKMELS